MSERTPEQRIKHALEALEGQFAQYKAKGKDLPGHFTSFGEYMRASFGKDRTFRINGIKTAPNVEARSMHLEALRHIEVQEAALAGMTQHGNGNKQYFDTAHLGALKDSAGVNLAAEGQKLDQFGSKQDLASRIIARKIEAVQATPATASVSTILMPAHMQPAQGIPAAAAQTKAAVPAQKPGPQITLGM